MNEIEEHESIPLEYENFIKSLVNDKGMFNFSLARDIAEFTQYKLCRESWGNTKYVVCQQGYDSIPCNTNTAISHNIPEGSLVSVPKYLQVNEKIDGNNVLYPYIPTNSDLFANDWMVIE